MAGEPSAAWPIALPPGFVVSVAASLALAFAYHALFGIRARGLGLALLAALLGFTSGEAIARWSGSDFGRLGAVHLYHGVAGAVVALVVVGIVERRGVRVGCADPEPGQPGRRPS